MGKVVEGIVNADENCQVVAGIDPRDGIVADYPVFKSVNDCTVKGDVIIDFSTAAAIPALIEYCKNTNTPAVLCTTGFSEELTAQVHEYAKDVALLKSANMSVGVNLILSVVKKMAETLYDSGFDIEIVEKHHNQKVDAPSGTALLLADAINGELDNEMDYTYDRSNVRQKREKKEIGISAVRGGTIVGEHEVIFAGTDEVIEVKHTAYSRAIFGKGAISAAKFLKDKTNGMYSMKDVIDAK
jgi:4-hydroxy-tetrahydrodipicolinate reductase